MTTVRFEVLLQSGIPTIVNFDELLKERELSLKQENEIASKLSPIQQDEQPQLHPEISSKVPPNNHSLPENPVSIIKPSSLDIWKCSLVDKPPISGTVGDPQQDEHRNLQEKNSSKKEIKYDGSNSGMSSDGSVQKDRKDSNLCKDPKTMKDGQRTTRITSVIEKIERQYATSGRNDSFGYDTEDPFIDNSEIVQVFSSLVL